MVIYDVADPVKVDKVVRHQRDCTFSGFELNPHRNTKPKDEKHNHQRPARYMEFV
jgi:hypothetical protein